LHTYPAGVKGGGIKEADAAQAAARARAAALRREAAAREQRMQGSAADVAMVSRGAHRA
jgi:hypothetical protein